MHKTSCFGARIGFLLAQRISINRGGNCHETSVVFEFEYEIIATMKTRQTTRPGSYKNEDVSQFLDFLDT